MTLFEASLALTERGCLGTEAIGVSQEANYIKRVGAPGANEPSAPWWFTGLHRARPCSSPFISFPL